MLGDWSKGTKKRTALAWIVGIYIALLHAAVVALVVQFDVLPKAIERIQMELARRRHAKIMERYNKVIDRPVVLLGDSNIWLFGPTPHSVNFGVSGEVTEGLLRSMPRYAPSVRKAGAVLLMIGINDLWAHKTNGLAERFGRIASAVPADVPLVWNSIVPAEDFRIDPADIKAANAAIAALCRARSGCTYVDTWSFLAKDGKQIPGLFRADGVHLSAEGYKQWSAALRGALVAAPGGSADQ